MITGDQAVVNCDESVDDDECDWFDCTVGLNAAAAECDDDADCDDVGALLAIGFCRLLKTWHVCLDLYIF